MKITTDHAASSYGIPIVLNDAGEPMDTAPGFRAVRLRLGLSRAEAAAVCGSQPRTVEAWEQGRFPVPAAALNVMGDLLRAAGRKAKAKP